MDDGDIYRTLERVEREEDGTTVTYTDNILNKDIVYCDVNFMPNMHLTSHTIKELKKVYWGKKNMNY